MDLAKISGTQFGIEDHGILTCFIYLDALDMSWHQGFGGYDLRGCCEKYIKCVLDTLKVRNWEDLIGVTVRFKRDSSLAIISIGHENENRWFTPKIDVYDLSEKLKFWENDEEEMSIEVLDMKIEQLKRELHDLSTNSVTVSIKLSTLEHRRNNVISGVKLPYTVQHAL